MRNRKKYINRIFWSLAILSVMAFDIVSVVYEVNTVNKSESKTEGSTFATYFKNIYDDPDTDSKAWARYWVSASYFTEERVDYEMKSMADAGISVVELQNSYYWCDTDYHKNVFLWILRAAKKYNLKLDFAGGKSYPTTMPATSAYYKKENMVHTLSVASVKVNQGEAYSGVLPLPEAEPSRGMPVGMDGPPPGVMPQETGEPAQAPQGLGEAPSAAPGGEMPGGGMPEGFPAGMGGNSVAPEPVGNAVAVVAVHIIGEDTYKTGGGFMGGRSSAGIPYSKIDKTIDLTNVADIENSTINWTAPQSETGHWEIVTFWKTLSGESTIDYLSKAATDAYCQYWDNEVLYNDEVRELFKQVGRNYWEDSLESITVMWTDELIHKFEQNRGYKFPRELMPVLLIKGMYSMSGSVNAPSKYEMEGDVDRMFRNDFYETLSELYNDNHLKGIQDFFKENYGMGFKCQVAYNYALDVPSATMVVDYPEYEGLDGNDETDAFRVFAGAMHTSGKKTFSSENCARMLNFSTDVYRVKFYDFLWHVNVAYSGGNNASVYHGVESAYDGTMWPGRGPVPPGFAEGFGPRMPYWKYMKNTVNAYIGRTQKVLQEGQPKMDLAIYFNWFDYGLFGGDKGWEYYTDRGLEGAGYSYEFISKASLDLKDCKVENGKLFNNGPAYKALIINAYRPFNTALATKGNGMIPVKSAQKILELAKAGLPVVVIGDTPSEDYNYSTYKNGQGNDEIQAAMKALLQLKNVVQVATEADAVEGLQKLGIYPDAQFEEKTVNLSSFHRANDDADFYFLFNRTHNFVLSGEHFDASNLNTDEAETLETDISFKGEGFPFLLDAWTGEITRITNYSKVNDRYKIHVKLEPSDTKIIAFANEHWAGDALTSPTPEVNPKAIQGEKELRSWTLQIESWEPNDAYKAGDFGRDNKNVHEIVKEYTDIDKDGQADTYSLNELKAWKEINPELQGVSGIGYYETTLELPSISESIETGYILDLGKTCEIFQVYVNGTLVDFNQFYPQADISNYLNPGKNTIKVEVASTIFNTAKTWNKGILDGRDAKGYWESYGLLGPVKVISYAETEL